MSGGVASLSSLSVAVEGCSFSGIPSLPSYCSSINARQLQSAAFDDVMEICESGSCGSDVIQQEGIIFQTSPLNCHSRSEQQQQQQCSTSSRMSSISDHDVDELGFQIIGSSNRTYETDMVDVLCGVVNQGSSSNVVSGRTNILANDMSNMQAFQTMHATTANDNEPSDRGSPVKSELGALENLSRSVTPKTAVEKCRLCGIEFNGKYLGVPPICMPCQALTDIQSTGMYQTLNGSSSHVPSGRRSVAESDGGMSHPPGCSTPKTAIGPCKVCGDDATGMYFGALVCVPCKTFFLRYAGDGFSFVCKFNKSCEITVATRTQCKYCRYQKCILAGMYRRVRPACVQLSEGQQLCVVCHDVANGIHFGAITCEGCKKFFRRGLTENSSYVCKSGQNCVINPRTRNACRYCRYQTCLNVGMSREAIQMGRPSKVTPDGQHPQRPVNCKVEGIDGVQLSPSMQHRHVDSQFPASAWRMTPPAYGENNAASMPLTWSPHDVNRHRRPNHSDSWSSSGVGSEFGVDGGVLGTDDAPSPKRRMSDSYMSSSSSLQYQFSPAGGGGNTTDACNTNVGSDSVGERSRISSASSSGHEVLLASASAASNVGTGLRAYVMGHSTGLGQWSTVPPNCNPPAPMYSTGSQQFMDVQNAQSNMMPIIVSSQQNDPNSVCMWQLNFLPTGVVGTQQPFSMESVGAGGSSMYNSAGSCVPFAAHQHHQIRQQIHHQQQPQIIGSITMARNDSTAISISDSMNTNGGSMHVHDLSDQIQHIMSESSAVIANCERSLNFPTSTLRATSSISNPSAAIGIGHQTAAAHHKNSSSSSLSSSIRDIMNTIDEEAIEAGQSQSFVMTDYQHPTTSGIEPDDRKSIVAPPGSVATVEIQQQQQQQLDYDRQADSIGGGHMVTDGGLTGRFSVDTMSAGSNNPDWMDQMTEHLVKDNIVVDTGLCFSSNQALAPAVDNKPLLSVYEQNLSTGDPELDEQVKSSIDYWLHPELPDENVMLASRHWAVLNKIMPAYCRFVQLGNNINKGLKAKFDSWANTHLDENERQSKLSVWIQQNVVPVYTYSSVSFFNCLPGFSHFTPGDKGTLIRCGQSMSRILVAALHWYVAEDRNFRNFLSWRTIRPGQVDRFKQSLIEYADRITSMEVDPIEASLLNALTVIASDYKDLENARMIEESRTHILGTFRAYTTAKYGTPNRRIEQLFEFIPEVRRLGLIHYKMTQSKTMGVAADGVVAVSSGSSCNNITPSSASTSALPPAYPSSGETVYSAIDNKHDETM